MRRTSIQIYYKFLENYIKAGRLYNPYQIAKKLTQSNGVIIFDNKDCMNDPLWFIALREMYGWDYTIDLQRLSVYLEAPEVKNGIITGGLFDIYDNIKLNKSLIVCKHGEPIHKGGYVYDESEYMEGVSRIILAKGEKAIDF